MTQDPDPWTCAYCGDRFPIPSLTTMHEHECELRPEAK
jgi:hypothetical protein